MHVCVRTRVYALCIFLCIAHHSLFLSPSLLFLLFIHIQRQKRAAHVPLD